MENYLTQITNYLLTQSWQIAALVAVIAAVNLALKNRSAHVRYLLWLIVLAKCLVPPLFTVPLAVLPEERPAVVVTMLDRSVAEPPVRPVTPVAVAQAPTIVERPARFNSRQWLVFGWVMGVAAFVIFAVTKALRTNSWLRRQRKLLPGELQSGIENLFSGLGIKTLPKVWLVDGIGQPFVWGLLRGGIYLPAEFVKLNNAEQRRGVLGHEISHILRFDAAVNILQIIAQAVFWFHPFVWWASKRIRAEREKCCDEMAIACLNAQAKDYSRAIVDTLVAEYKSTRPVPSLAVAGPVKNIEERIKTMLRPGKKFYKHPSLPVVAIVVLTALLAVPTTVVLTVRAENQPSTDSTGAAPIFGNLTNLGPTVNSSAGEYGPSISADGLSLYFQSNRPGGYGKKDIWVTKRASVSDPWGPPVNLGPIVNSSSYEWGPCISADGLELFFYPSVRPGGFGESDISVTTRKTKADPWGTPVNLGPTVNSSVTEGQPSISADGLSLYYTSWRTGYGKGDLWVTRRVTTNDPWRPSVNLGPTVNSSSKDTGSSISTDGLLLYFVSDRPGGYGEYDIWVTRRASLSDSWGPPVNLGPTVNSSSSDGGPNISADGSTLFFHSERPGGFGPAGLWQVSLKEHGAKE
jgi:beta-lactamase regulating signal transducer with metallopeptidase domain/Tol biopolymer transport system component